MKKKINSCIIGIAVFTIVITTIVMTVVFYAQLKNQVFSDLGVVADVLMDNRSYDSQNEDLRITIIAPDGKVSYDSVADAQTLENHLNRPEIIEAAEKGRGNGIRRSDTLAETVFYYAVQLDDGSFLRVGKAAHSVFAILLATLPIVIGVALLLAVICSIVSHYLTSAITRPIEKIAGDMDHISENDIYPELIPFTNKIKSQHEEILSSTNIRQEFTANVTHELKTPLAAISGYAELIETGMVNEKDIRHFSGEIRKSSARLLTLINDIIKLSQLDAGNPGEVSEEADLAAIASESVEMLAMGAAKKQVELTYEGDREAIVKIGREPAQELIYNLIENAVRYNRPDGKVWVRVIKEGAGASLVVEDTGIGIPEEHQERIFERFYRVDKSRSKELGGTGLGLAIVKHICLLTNADLKLTSAPGVGTKVEITWK